MVGQVAFRVQIPSDPAQVSAVVEAISTRLSEAGVNDQTIRVLEIVAVESVTNAIRHGNHEDPGKLVTVELELEPDGITLRVSDQGEGFSLDDVRDPSQGSGVYKPGGRGVMMIRHLMDTAELSNGGTCLTMWKRIEQ